MSNLTKEQFDTEISRHTMIIEADDGKGNRRIYFGRPGTMNMHFRIITFADYLVYTGDMGTYVFRRLSDMFNFFRGDGINPNYWSEKLESADGCGGYLEFDFKHAIATLRRHTEDLPDEKRQQIEDEFEYIKEDEWSFVHTARECCAIPQSYWDDFCNRDIMVYSYRYLWCCYAIVWAVTIYDAAQEVEAAA